MISHKKKLSIIHEENPTVSYKKRTSEQYIKEYFNPESSNKSNDQSESTLNYIRYDKLSLVSLDNTFFKELIELEIQNKFNFSYERFNKMVSLYIKAIEYLKLKDLHQEADILLQRMHKMLSDPSNLTKIKEKKENKANSQDRTDHQLEKKLTINRIKMKFGTSSKLNSQSFSGIIHNQHKNNSEQTNEIIENNIKTQSNQLKDRLAQRRNKNLDSSFKSTNSPLSRVASKKFLSFKLDSSSNMMNGVDEKDDKKSSQFAIQTGDFNNDNVYFNNNQQGNNDNNEGNKNRDENDENPQLTNRTGNSFKSDKETYQIKSEVNENDILQLKNESDSENDISLNFSKLNKSIYNKKDILIYKVFEQTNSFQLSLIEHINQVLSPSICNRLLKRSDEIFEDFSINLKIFLSQLKEAEENESDDVVLIKESIENSVGLLKSSLSEEVKEQLKTFVNQCFVNEKVQILIEKWKFNIINEFNNSISYMKYR